MEATDSTNGVVIFNPVGGNAHHRDSIHARATELGYRVEVTEAAGDAVVFAREAAEAGVEVLVSAGGDGTLNEVVRGIAQADALDRVTLGVLPTGTGNNFAQNIGITTTEEGFEVLQHGERRTIDLGLADGRPFVNSCVGGLTADASGETTPELKQRLGVLAYVLTTLSAVASFEGLRLKVTARSHGGESSEWSGEAICVLIGNGRQFTTQRGRQANMEDGLFDVLIVEDVPATDLVSDTVVERLFGEESEHIIRLQASVIEVTSEGPDPVNFSLDGEMVQHRTLSLEVQPKTLCVLVGESYEVVPDEE